MLKKTSFSLPALLLLLTAAAFSSLAAAADGIQVNVKNKLVFKTADGQHQFRIGGRLQWDITAIGRDGNYQSTSQSQIRRARLYLSGTTAQVWDFKFQFDFEDADDSDQAIEDAYIRYTGLPVKITLGQRKMPYGMYGLTSSKYIAFIERSMVSGLFNSEKIGVGGRAPGITLTYKWHDFLVEGGYYLLRTPAGEARDIDSGNGMSGRAIWAHYDKEQKRLLHVGLAGGFKHYADGVVERIRVRPGVSSGARIIDTRGTVSADDYSSFNLQLAGLYQRLWGSAEYYHGSFDLADSANIGDDTIKGFYVQAGFFLTDDSRPYKKGVWSSVKPSAAVGKGGIGAWEIALRYDDVEMGAGLIDGGQADQNADTFAVALNWYPINNLRFQANYITASCDQCAFDNGDPSFFVLRSQIFF